MATASETEQIRVIVVDDHPLLRTGLRLIVGGDPGFALAGEAGSREDALALARAAQPDVVLLDLDLAGDFATEWLPELRAVAPRARVLILTALRDTTLHRACIRLGARGVILKTEAADSVLKAIRKVHDGELWLDRCVTAELIGDLIEAQAARVGPDQPKADALTMREREVIVLVAEGLKNRAIAERLFISETTVRHHLTAIFSKLDVHDRLELVLYAFRNGLATLQR